MNKVLFIFLLIAFSSHNLYSQDSGSKTPYVLFDDFETGELFSWEPYPYAQDIGSHRLFFAQKSPTFKGSKYSLSTLFPASDAVELSNGFTKRLNFWTTAETRVRFAVFFQADRNPATLEISLGTFNGKRYFHTLKNPEANQWVEVDVPLTSFTSKAETLAPGEHIQVVTIKADYPSVYWLNTYTIFMDDFNMNGVRDLQFKATNPTSTNLEMFNTSVLNKHFFYGDIISLQTVPETNFALKKVTGTLLDGNGKLIKDNIPFERNESAWFNNSIYKIKEADARGEWKIKINAVDANNQESHTTFNFLMPGKRISGYPRLFFSASDLKQRIANEKSPVAKLIFDRAKENVDFKKVDVDAIKEGKDLTAENLVGGPYGKYTVGFGSYQEWINPSDALADVISQGSLHYAFTGDKASAEQAKKALLKLCSFSKWNAEWMIQKKFWSYYPVGYLLTSVTYGYDMLHDLLTEKERALVRNAMLEQGLKPFHRDMVEMNRMPSNNSNHIAVKASGAMLAAIVMLGEDPQNPHMEPYLSGVLVKAKTFMDRTYYADGSYGEPKSGYMNMATRAIVELMATAEKNLGIDYTSTTNVEDFYKYPLYAIDSKSTIQDFGDGNSSFKGFTEIHSEWFVHRTGNPFLYQYIKPFWEAGNGGFMGYLWFRDDINPVSRETLPSSEVFSATGMVMRSGWDDKSTIISSHVGPNSNHYHYDQGSFQVMTNGEALLTDPGAGGYYANLEYLTYNVQAIAHNVMLVDHDPESQAPADYDNGITSLRDWPRVSHSFTGKNVDALESDLATVYKGKLAKYSRTLLFQKSGPLFMFDNVKSKSPEGHVFSWIFHAPQNAGFKSAISVDKNRMTIDKPNARLSMQVLSPDIESAKIRERNVQSESFISFASKPAQTETQFLAVVIPQAKPVTANDAVPATITKMAGAGWIGAKVQRFATIDYGFFQTGENPAVLMGGYKTDATKLTTSINTGNELFNLYFQGSNFSGEGLTISSDQQLTCAVEKEKNSLTVEFQSTKAAVTTISLDRQPSQILLNGQAIKSKYNAGSKLATLAVPEGKSTFIIKY